MNMAHHERRKWIREIANINTKINEQSLLRRRKIEE